MTAQAIQPAVLCVKMSIFATYSIRMHLILFDDKTRVQLLPFTHTRPVADIRCGILTPRERWEHILEEKDSGSLVPAYMQEVFPARFTSGQVYINGAVFATAQLAAKVRQLPAEATLYTGDLLVAYKTDQSFTGIEELAAAAAVAEREEVELSALQHVWDIFAMNESALRSDFALLTAGRSSQPLPGYVTAIRPGQIFVEPGAQVLPCIINASEGPVYIGREAMVMEGCMLRGPIALGEHAVIKMGAKVYGATTIGPGCKVGGEIGNVVFFAHSNKGHDGYLGNAVIGEWCNLGADTNCSNLKNNYDVIKIWNEYENKSVKTGLQFCGLLMADHSKCGINTMFNTGTVAGVSCNIYGGGFPDKFIPSFSWGGKDGMMTYDLHKALEAADRMMGRRGIQLSEAERAMLAHVYETTAKQRAVLHHA